MCLVLHTSSMASIMSSGRRFSPGFFARWLNSVLNILITSELSLLTIIPCFLSHKTGTEYFPATAQEKKRHFTCPGCIDRIKDGNSTFQDGALATHHAYRSTFRTIHERYQANLQCLVCSHHTQSSPCLLRMGWTDHLANGIPTLHTSWEIGENTSGKSVSP